jgi:hypothetical protein
LRSASTLREKEKTTEERTVSALSCGAEFAFFLSSVFEHVQLKCKDVRISQRFEEEKGRGEEKKESS